MSRKANLDAKVQEIVRIASQDLPGVMKTGYTDEVEKQVQQLRYNMDSLIVQVVFGANFSPGKTADEPKIHWTQKMPSLVEISQITDALNKYIEEYEVPYYAQRHLLAQQQVQAQPQQQAQDQDMSIPGQNIAGITVDYPVIPTLDKAKKKDMKSILFTQGMIRRYLNVPAVMALAAMGEEIRHRQNVTLAIVIGGITIGLAGATIAGVAYYNKKKDEEELEALDADLDVDVPGIDIDSPVALLSDDAPVTVTIA